MNSDLLMVFSAVEKVLGNMKIKDRWGNPVLAVECFGYLELKSGGEWGRLLDSLKAGTTSEKEFAYNALSLVNRVAKERAERFKEKHA